jgi:hypothetical protein
MTVPRRMTVLCRDVKVLLEAAGYDVVIVPERSLQQRFLAHLIALQGNADVRYIWIKIAIQPFINRVDVEMHCVNEIREIRKRLAHYPQQAHFHKEIWVATADGRFQCYEVSADAIREILKGERAPVVRMEGVSA